MAVMSTAAAAATMTLAGCGRSADTDTRSAQKEDTGGLSRGDFGPPQGAPIKVVRATPPNTHHRWAATIRPRSSLKST